MLVSCGVLGKSINVSEPQFLCKTQGIEFSCSRMIMKTKQGNEYRAPNSIWLLIGAAPHPNPNTNTNCGANLSM